MKISIRDLWRLDGVVDRGPYFLLGAMLMAVKFNLDRWLYSTLFDRTWSPFDFEFALNFLFRWDLYPQDPKQAAILIAAALPFIWAGLALTLRRLRSAALPPWLVVLFFVPLVKFIFFALLCILPPREKNRPALPSQVRWWDALFPPSVLGSAIAAMILTSIPALLLAWLCTTRFASYSATLFIGIPFCQGFIAVLLAGYRESRSIGACIGVANLSLLCTGLGILALAWEGAICLLMAAPLGAVLATVGACFGYVVQNRRHANGDTARLSCITLLAIPSLMWMEKAQPPAPPLFAVTSVIDVAAPPERVWQNVVTFSELPPPDEWLFKLGIAYPVRASIAGIGVGAIRRCEFSTGPFIEPIEVWDEPRLLKFSVTENPAPLQEWTPYRAVHPPHLHGFLCSRGGQFHLIAQPDGGTRLEGTTWYQHHMWPAAYWQLWSDYLIHKIHLRVLRHVAQLSEKR
jgi:uncharacterized membrane protein YhaH (DUF805 family)